MQTRSARQGTTISAWTLPDGPARLPFDFIPVGSEPTTPTTFVFYDNVTVTPTIAAIPEPETYAMLLAGLGVMAWLARRRRAAAQAYPQRD